METSSNLLLTWGGIWFESISKDLRKGFAIKLERRSQPAEIGNYFEERVGSQTEILNFNEFLSRRKWSCAPEELPNFSSYVRRNLKKSSGLVFSLP
jgi:hypothetical protein